MSKKIRVLLVEDSIVALGMLQRILNSSDHIEVVGTATDGIQGLSMYEKSQPDVVCTDLQMPNMDGFEFCREIVKRGSVPILVVSNAVHPTDVDNIFQLMQIGGKIDFFPKPSVGTDIDQQKLKSLLETKIRIIYGQ